MILKLDFVTTSEEMTNTLTSYKQAIETTINSLTLEQFLRIVLRVGNFLNKVSTSKPSALKHLYHLCVCEC